MPLKGTKPLTHFNDEGQVHMVDVSDKTMSHRQAVARGQISMQPSTLTKIKSGGHKKGDVLTIARISAIMATKKTSDLIPLCHPIGLSNVNVKFSLDETLPGVHCEVTAKTTERTGIEMEALMGVNAALLTIYDMCKAIDRGMEIQAVHLLHKSGGKSGAWSRDTYKP